MFYTHLPCFTHLSWARSSLGKALAIGLFLSPLTSSGAATPSPAHPIQSTNLTRPTILAALNFITPRQLTAYTAQQLCTWGASSLQHVKNSGFILTTLPAQADQPAQLRAVYAGTPFFTALIPKNAHNASQWSALSTAFLAQVHQHVPAFRNASDEDLLSYFLNGMLAHIDHYSHYTSPRHTNVIHPHAATETNATSTSSPAPLSPATTTAVQHTSTPSPQSSSPATVGLTLQLQNNAPAVAAINLNSPVWDQNIGLGDILTQIDSESTQHLSISAIQEKLSGPEGSPIKLNFHTHAGQDVTINVTRAIMPKESVIPDLSNPYPILRVARFADHTAEEISQYVSALLPDTPSNNEEEDNNTPAADVNEADTATTTPSASTPQKNTPPSPGAAPQHFPGLILDLRGNHGGFLQQAVMTASLFLNHGLIATTEGRARSANHIWSIQGGDLTNNAPLILLVDKNTASAAEVLAAALADQQRAVIIGSSSFGKGMVQVSAIMPNGGRLTLTWGHNTAPLGWPLQGLGVIPQICTSLHAAIPLKKQLHALDQGHSLLGELLQKSRLVRNTTNKRQLQALRHVCPPSLPNLIDIPTALHILANPTAYHAALSSLPNIRLTSSAP